MASPVALVTVWSADFCLLKLMFQFVSNICQPVSEGVGLHAGRGQSQFISVDVQSAGLFFVLG